ncbi:DNA cytosine methyltransferase [Variovorax sp. LjRoot175]|uniref:DNA cytosine methyltransferase n=1 Tax=Variovorax sp. LjRoot175 TaxID=3342276 RepID=UPI003ECC4D5D
MLTPQFQLGLAAELVVDLFAGGGGASTGIEQAIGRHVDIAINHDPEAIALHQANHPQTRHYVSDVFEVDPLQVTEGRPVGLLWASPDCKHFSKAKGGKPVSKKIRSLAWVVVKWAKAVRPRMIFLENVEEFQTWGPLTEDGMPCPKRKGETFRAWVRAMEQLGGVVECRELRASEYRVPTIRKRLFIIIRFDGEPIVWPEPTSAKPDSLPVRAKKLKPWRTAAECIDWDLPCPSIFDRKRPLAEATLRRIAKGVMRYVVEAADPFIVPLTHQGGDRTEDIREPLRTVTGAQRGEKALIVPTLVPFLTEHANASNQRTFAADEPLRTQCAQVKGGHFALVSAFLAQHNNHRGVVPSDGRPATAPISTITAKGAQQTLVTSNLVKLRGTSTAQGVYEPLHTISAQGTHFAEVRAFLLKYFGTDQDPRLDEPMHTVTTKDRFALVTVHGEEYAIVDIGLRMLTPRELYRAQGFDDSYIIDIEVEDRLKSLLLGEKFMKRLSKTAQVRMCGNSVCPPLAAAIVAANYRELGQERAVA